MLLYLIPASSENYVSIDLNYSSLANFSVTYPTIGYFAAMRSHERIFWIKEFNMTVIAI
ncbi:MAG: hypothetical protein ACRC06_07510 [Waterburya sp.]